MVLKTSTRLIVALRTEHAFKLSAVRTALDYAAQELGVTDLLAGEDLYACPGELFLERYGQLFNLNRAGRLGIQAVLQGLLQRIQWDKGLAVRFPQPQRARKSRTWPRAKSGTHLNAEIVIILYAPR